jgi:cyclopropane fatty-acyl-phospholipid synthase-like methyltransferase
MPLTHPRDLSSADLELALSTARRGDILSCLVDTSRKAFGFFTSHFPHTINYPWISERLESLPPGAHVLDIGAGVSPLPLWLARRGCYIDTVDNHRVIRTLPVTNDWNEWGYFDYHRLHENITSHHRSVQEFEPAYAFDAIYSVSVLAHMSGQIRETTLRRCREWLGSGGTLLLAIDLIPFSDFLWNRSEGREVEPLSSHGAINDLVDQLKDLNFQIRQLELVRAVNRSRTDLLFVKANIPRFSR